MAVGTAVLRQRIARGLDDCQCGHNDERDHHFARLSYRYTFANTSPRTRRWMGGLPHRFRFRLGDREALAVHGSPRRKNEFLWESGTPTISPTSSVKLPSTIASAIKPASGSSVGTSR